MQIVSNVALISINETLVVQLISFLIFLYVINRIMFRPLRSTIDERTFYMEEMKSEIDDAGKNYEKALAEIRAQEDAIKTAALKLKQEREDAGAQEAAEILAAAQAEIASDKKKNAAEVAEQIAHARKSLGTESEALARLAMEKILDRRLNP